MVTANTNTYNDAFTERYRYLIGFAKQDHDRVHDSYLKVLKTINGNGFTAHTNTELKKKLIIYTKTAIYNGFKTENVLKKNFIEINYKTENKLQQNNLEYLLEKKYDIELEFLISKLFEYLKKFHTQENNYVFRVYFLYDKNNKKITYKQLSEITGFSISKCCMIIQKLKTDLNQNLINYINGT